MKPVVTGDFGTVFTCGTTTKRDDVSETVKRSSVEAVVNTWTTSWRLTACIILHCSHFGF